MNMDESLGIGAIAPQGTILYLDFNPQAARLIILCNTEETGGARALLAPNDLAQILGDIRAKHGAIDSLFLAGLELRWDLSNDFLGPLDKLTIENCRIGGFIDQFSRYSVLTIRNSAIGYFLSMSMRSSGHVNLMNLVLTGYEAKQGMVAPNALIDVRNASIGGHFAINNILLVIEDGRTRPHGSDIHLHTCTVDGKVMMSDCQLTDGLTVSETSAHKGIELSRLSTGGAIVMRDVGSDGSLSIRQATVTGADTALSLSNLDLKGGLLVEHTTLTGALTCQMSNIGKNLVLKAVSVNTPTPGTRRELLTFSGCTVGGTFWPYDVTADGSMKIENLTARKGAKLGKLNLNGQATLRNGTIYGDLELHGCEIKSTDAALTMAAVSVSGSMLIHDNTFTGKVFCHTPDIGMNLTFGRTTILANESDTVAVSIESGRIGSGLLMHLDCKIHGRIAVNSTKVGGINIEGIFARAIPSGGGQYWDRNAIHFSGVECTGALWIHRNRLQGGVSTYGSRLGSNFCFRNNILSFAAAGAKTTSGTSGVRKDAEQHDIELNLSGMDVTGNIVIENITLSADLKVYIRYDNASCRRIIDQNLKCFTGGEVWASFEQFDFGGLSDDASEADFRARIKLVGQRGRRGKNKLPASAQPYFHLSQLLEREGRQELADFATIEMKRAVGRQIRNPVGRLFSFLFGLGFGHGLSKLRTTLSLLAFVALGVFGVEAALRSDMLVLDAGRVVSAVVVTDSGEVRPANSIVAPGAAMVSEIACTNEIQPIFYAIELLIPIMEFGQEKQCILRLSPAEGGPTQREITGWWAARYAYTIVGWLIVSLAVVTFSGIVRQQRRD